MLPEIESLLVLQDHDQRILSLKKDIERIPADKERAKERLAKDLDAVEQAKKAVQENEVAIKNLELDIGTRKNTLDRLKVQQYETKKNDEFTALENEINRYNGEVDDLETEELELMEKADSLRLELQKAEDALALTQSMVDEEIAQLDERAGNAQARYEEVSGVRAKLAADVDEDLLSLYERLMKSKGGDAVVSAENSQCHGCHMKVVPSTMIKVQADKEITQCENCGRILYL
ncbi:MAG: zinc ribbon domain-containing protein [Akkermansiaceae bacterium]